MNSSNNLFRSIILIIGVIAIIFDVLIYNSFEKLKDGVDSLRDKQDVESEFNTNKFKYQQEQMERLGQEAENTLQQIREQKEAMLQEIEKRKQVENEGKDVQASLVDIKAQTDAIKQYIKGWQKDYVSVLAELEKKIGDSQGQIKNLESNLVANTNALRSAIEKINRHPANPQEATQTQQ